MNKSYDEPPSRKAEQLEEARFDVESDRLQELVDQAKTGPFQKGEVVKIHPDHLESHEDPDDEYVVVGEGESPYGAVEVRSKKGLRAIHQVHASSLRRHA